MNRTRHLGGRARTSHARTKLARPTRWRSIRCVQPANVLLTAGPTPHVKLSHSIVATRFLIEQHEQRFGVCGTPRYMAPEVRCNTRSRDNWLGALPVAALTAVAALAAADCSLLRWFVLCLAGRLSRVLLSGRRVLVWRVLVRARAPAQHPTPPFPPHPIPHGIPPPPDACQV
jgi:serine/threonine protein kinase